MKHRLKKIKFANGYDADHMLMRKLSLNFFRNNRLETTLAKIKILKPDLEKTVTSIKGGTNSDLNRIKAKYGPQPDLESRFAEIRNSLKKISGGFTRIVKLGYRNSDGSEMARLEWAYPVVLEKPVEPVKKEKSKKVPGKKI